MPTGAASAIHLNVGSFGLTAEQNLPELTADTTHTLDVHAWFHEAPFADASSPSTSLPLDLEIGSGKGTFLVQHAPLEPGVRFLGVEYAKAFWRHAADRIRRHDIHNVRLLHADAVTLVRHHLPAQCVRQVHIYFPDPWPKARHHKRRTVREDVLRDLHRILQNPDSSHLDSPSGQIRIATDHADYFAWMLEHAERVLDLFDKIDYTPLPSAQAGEWVGSNFERKYKEQGRTFQGFILRKRGP